MAKKVQDVFSRQAREEFVEEYRHEVDGSAGKRESLSTAINLDIKSAVHHNVIVKVDQRLVDDISYGSLTLKKDPTYDVYRNTKICAEVVSVPTKLRGSVLYENAPGWPSPQGRIAMDGKPSQTMHERSFTTLEGTEIRIRKGDKIYFHYLVLTDQNYLGKDTEGMELYMCAYDQIFCVVKELKVEWNGTHVQTDIQFINGWVAVKPFYDEAFEAVQIPELTLMGKETGKTRTVRVKQSESGIIYDMAEKPLYRHGEIAHRSIAPDGKDYGFEAGDKVVYSHYSEFKNTIEGEEYFIMRLWDVVGKYTDGRLDPINDMVLIDSQEHAESKLIIPDKYKPKPHDATVLAVGNNVEALQKGDKVYYNHHETYFLKIPGFKGAFIKENQIAFKYAN